MLFFTLYNQLPINFLPLPKKYLYLLYPIITFSQTNTNKIYSFNKIEFNESINENIQLFDDYWKDKSIKDYGEEIANKKMKDLIKNIESTETEMFDKFQVNLNIQNLKIN